MDSSSSSNEEEFAVRRLSKFRERVDWGTLSRADFIERYCKIYLFFAFWVLPIGK
jgi:hypothetical protein